MYINKKLSAAASAIIIGGMVFSGCGGSDSTINNETTVDLETIKGSVTASKFKYAKVYLDLDGSGDYSSGDSEIACTDENGEFSINYPVDENSSYIIMAENQDGTYCDGETIRYMTNGEDDQVNPDFMMFIPYEGNSTTAAAVNPTNFIKYLQELNEEGNITITEGQSDADIFKAFIKDKKANFKSILEKIKASADLIQNARNLDSTKEDLDLDTNTTIAFNDTNKTSVELASLGVYKEQSVPAKIGNLIVSTPLNKIGKLSEVETTVTEVNNAEIKEGATAAKIDDNGSTSNNVILKKPIFAVINDNKNRIKLVLGNKSNIKDLGDITLSITPYEDILSIPEYAKLRDTHNASVMLGADITVEDSNGKRVNVTDLADISKTIAGVVLDKHNEIDAKGLKYYYYNGTDWVEDGEITDGGALTLNDKFRLVPYVIAKPNDMQAVKTITVDGLDNVKDPIVVAKAKVSSLTPTNSKVLYKEDADSIILDATADTNGNTVKVRVPNGFNIDELVVLGEKLDKVTTEKKNSVSIDLSSGSNVASLSAQLPIITDSGVISELSPKLLQNLHMEKLYSSFELPYYGYTGDATSQSSDKQKAYYIIGTNVANFIGDPKTTQNTFYSGKDINASTTLSWVDKYDDNSTKRERTLSIDSTNNTLTRDEKNYDQTSGILRYTKRLTLKFENSKVIKTVTKSYTSNNIGTDYQYYNRSGSSYDATVTFNKVDVNTTNVTFKTDNPYKNVSTYSYEGESSTSTYTNHVKLAGKASIKFNSLFGKVEKLYSSEFDQQFNKTSKYSDSAETYYTSVNGKIISSGSSSINFDGTYKLSTDSYGVVDGGALLDYGNYEVNYDSYNDEYYNSNGTNTDTKLIFRSNKKIEQAKEDTNTTIMFGSSSKVIQNGSFGTVDIDYADTTNAYTITLPVTDDNLNKSLKIGFDMFRESTQTQYKIAIDELTLTSKDAISQTNVNVCINAINDSEQEYLNSCKELAVSSIISLDNSNISIDAETIIESFNKTIPNSSETVQMNVYAQNLCTDAMIDGSQSFSVDSIELTNPCLFGGTVITQAKPTQKSQKVLTAVNDLENFDITQESLADKLNSIKQDMGTTNLDEITMTALTDLALVYNNSIVSNIIETNSNKTSIVDEILDHIENPDTISLDLANAPSINSAIDLLNESAEALKKASDELNSSFEDQTYVMTYSSDENITYNDSLVIRSAALANAALLKFISAYSYGEDSLYEEKLHTDGISTYRLIDIDEKSVLNHTTFFKLNDLTKLSEAKALLKEFAQTATLIDITKIDDQEDKNDITDLKTDAQKLLDAFNSANGLFTDGNTIINVNNLFNSSYAIDRDDFGSAFDYNCNYDLNISIMMGEPRCDNYMYADTYNTVTITADTSTLDEVLIKAEKSGVIYDTPQGIIEQFAND